jgi:hypothetical protein
VNSSGMEDKRTLISLIIWWYEGTKLRKDKRWKNANNCPIEVTNTDPKLIKIFVDFLRLDLKIENKNLKGRIQIHEGDDQIKIEKFWSKVSGIPQSQFNKTIVRTKGNKIGKNLGTFTIRTYDKILYMKLKDLLEAELLGLSIGD